MKFYYIIGLVAAVVSAQELPPVTPAVEPPTPLPEGVAVEEMRDLLFTLHDVVNARIDDIHIRIAEIQNSTSALALEQAQGAINRDIGAITTAIQQAAVAFNYHSGINIGEELAQNSLNQNQTLTVITSIAKAADVLMDISDCIALTTSRLNTAVSSAFYDEISYVKSALALFLLPVGGLVVAVQYAESLGMNADGTLQAVSWFGEQAQTLLASRF
ncbi:hypothetical protein GQ53DRAFT_827397 [Thozetella sp. PMI_491]|nr:hypothetical protein GQ53DRAFT_827397 [Thozetella sp. PMI_491]